jgi:hypothetical protein
MWVLGATAHAAGTEPASEGNCEGLLTLPLLLLQSNEV